MGREGDSDSAIGPVWKEMRWKMLFSSILATWRFPANFAFPLAFMQELAISGIAIYVV